MEFKIKLLGKEDVALNTKTFFFSRPSSFSYIAGQYIYLTIPRPDSARQAGLDQRQARQAHLTDDPRGDTRHFTLSSSPTEKNLSITTRLRKESVYKQALDGLKIGGTLKMRGPNGTFFLESDGEVAPQVMIAGGIGVTPYRSIIRYVADKNLKVPIHLICSNSIPEEIAFKKEFDDIVKTHKNIQVTYTITHPEESKVRWTGKVGRVDESFLRNFLRTTLSERLHYQLRTTFWVCGPPAMTSAVEETLEKMGVGDIREEKFTGY